MTPLGWVLTGIGILVAIVLILLADLIFGKLRLVVDYRKGELSLWLEWLFLKYKIYPDPEKQEYRKKRRQFFRNRKSEQRKHTPEATDAVQRPEAPPEKKGVRAAAKREVRKAVQSVPLKEYAKTLKIIVTDFIAKFHCKSLVLYASIGGGEASDIAMDYGTVNALLYPVLGAFAAAGRLHKCDVQLTPDFTAEETHAEGRAVFTFRLYQAFGCIWKLSEELYE